MTVPKQTAKNEATASNTLAEEAWQQTALQLIAEISQLSESVTTAAQTKNEDPQMAQWVLKRGELIQQLLSVITPNRVALLPPSLSESIQEQIKTIQQLDTSANQAFQSSLGSIRKQLQGVQSGKTTLRGYQLESGNQTDYTRSQDV